MKLLIRTLVCISLIFFSMASYAKPSWNEWVQQLRKEAIADGIRPQLFDDVFQDIHEPNTRVIHLDKTQPEKRLTFMQYRKSRIDAFRIRLGVSAYKKHRALLDEIGQKYGVDPCFIVAEWGIESSYGHYKGNFPVIQSLATLAYDGRRSDFFRNELMIALHILNEGHIDNAEFKGEWAGASGHPQFLPSSWKKYAVDYEGNGHKNIWTSYPDVFASIANYLKMNGWQTGQPWAIQVELPVNFPEAEVGYRIQKPVTAWVQLGVKSAYGFFMPKQDLSASIVKPLGGPDFMIFNNFRTILRYNNTTFYAGSVGYLADEICKRLHTDKAVFGGNSQGN